MSQYRKTPRASFITYDDGDYFVTMCTKNKNHYFGRIKDGVMNYSEIGEYCLQQLKNASHYSKYIEIVIFTVMPNHVHAIVRVKGKGVSPICVEESESIQRSPNPAIHDGNTCQRHVPTLGPDGNTCQRHVPTLGPDGNTCQRHVPTLGRYISSFKGAVTKYANSRGIDFGWQSRYHDHLIRGHKDENKIYEYILNNVSRWEDDCFS